MKGCLLALWVTSILVTSAINPNPPDGFDHSIYLDAEEYYRLFWKFDTETITFEVSEVKIFCAIFYLIFMEFYQFQQNDIDFNATAAVSRNQVQQAVPTRTYQIRNEWQCPFFFVIESILTLT